MTVSDLVFHICNLDDGISFKRSMALIGLVDVSELPKVIKRELDPINTPKVKNKKVDVCRTRLWKKVRLYMLENNKNACCKCGSRPSINNLHVDHIKPKSKYPHLAFKVYNLQLLCKKCNFEKGNKNCDDYRALKYKNNAFEL